MFGLLKKFGWIGGLVVMARTPQGQKVIAKGHGLRQRPGNPPQTCRTAHQGDGQGQQPTDAARRNCCAVSLRFYRNISHRPGRSARSVPAHLLEFDPCTSSVSSSACSSSASSPVSWPASSSPANKSLSVAATIVLGIVGSFVGGFLGYLIFRKDSQDGFFQISGIIGSVIGAIIVLLLWTRFGSKSRR